MTKMNSMYNWGTVSKSYFLLQSCGLFGIGKFNFKRRHEHLYISPDIIFKSRNKTWLPDHSPYHHLERIQNCLLSLCFQRGWKRKRKCLISEPLSVNRFAFTATFSLGPNCNIVLCNNLFSVLGKCLLQKSMDSISMQKKIRFTQTRVTSAKNEGPYHTVPISKGCFVLFCFVLRNTWPSTLPHRFCPF